uniref:Expansin n=1 Tax=Aegilops tauschii TaxID=37682 RepID=M8AZB8_AEGTA
MVAGMRFLQLFAVVLAFSFVPAKSGYWLPAHATFYGGADGSDTMGGACGYENLYNAGYGINNAALSTALFNNGLSCGQCYLITCDTSKSNMCKPGTSITVSATNFCPPNWALPSDNATTVAWSQPSPRPLRHAQPAWENLAIYRAGIVPVLYQQVACQRQGGLRFTINGFNYFELVLVTNMAGSGSVKSMSVKGTNTAWIPMSQNWGANWQCLAGLKGQALSFAITSSGGQYKVFQDVVPAWWLFGQTFSTWQQFDY